MNKYKVIFAVVVFSLVSNLQANTNNDFEYTPPLKKNKLVDTCCILSIDDINFVEVEQEIELGFNPYNHLPANFNPYQGFELNIDDIHIIEDDQEIDLGFDVDLYLPANFNPHFCPKKCDIQ
jgi:hypothetical protein